MATTSRGAPYPVGTDKVRDGDNAIQALAEWASTDFIKAGRVDRVIEGNGYLRLTPAESFFTSNPAQAVAITAIGINEAFRPTWDGTVDGSGCLLKVWKPDNTQWPPGATVAIYYAAHRR